MAIAAGEYHNPAILATCQFNLVGDLDDDCKDDLSDLKILAEQWLAEEGSANLDNVGFVNFNDFALLAKNWLVDCSVEQGNPACVDK